MAKTVLTTGQRANATFLKSNESSDFNGVDDYEKGVLVDVTLTSSEKKDSDGVAITDESGKPVTWTLFKYRDKTGVVISQWVGSDRITLSKSDIGETIQVKFTVFNATKDYEKGGIKVGDTTQVVREVIAYKGKVIDEVEKTYEERMYILAEVCGKHNVAIVAQ